MPLCLYFLLTILLTTNASIIIKNPRIRRHTDTIHHLNIHGWHLELQHNSAIKSPHYDDCEFYKGRVLNEDQSIATVTDCNGQLYGLLQAGKDEFVLQPTQADGTHVLRHRDAFLLEQPGEFNLTGDTVDDLELDYEDAMRKPGLRSWNQSDIEYFDGPTVVTRPLSGVGELWIELAIVADHTLLNFHGKERVSYYVMALMNIASAILNDASLGLNITLVINHLFLYEENHKVIKPMELKRSLQSVNQWNYKHLMNLPHGSSGWDATIWLTRTNLNGPSGYASKDGMCTKVKSAAIVHDEGLTSAFLIVHEMAHLLGVGHDDEKECNSPSRRGSVMEPLVRTTFNHFFWSSCSKRQLQERARRKWCLHQRGKSNGLELQGNKELPNYVFTMNDQCRSEFGEGYTKCNTIKAKTSECSLLRCSHPDKPDMCMSKKGPPLEGTPCGHNRWCIQGECERIYRREKSKPTWSEWGEWSECGAGCGYGLRTRVRKCRSKSGRTEQSCDGASIQMSSCWSGVTCASLRDIRTDACYWHNQRLIPYVPVDESKQCRSFCVDYSGGEALEYGNIPDGAPCSYERPFDICSEGVCVPGQCSPTDPVCNWCPEGNCNNITLVFTRHVNITQRGWTRLTMIPHEARLLSIRIKTPVPLYIELRGKREKIGRKLIKHTTNKFKLKNNYYLRYDPNEPQNLQIVEVDRNVIELEDEERYGFEGRVVSAGAVVKWRRTDDEVVITAESRLLMDLMILAVPEHQIADGGLVTVDIAVNYSTPAQYGRARHVKKSEYVWKPDEWEECSATCGDHGVQERQLFCVPYKLSISTRRDLIRNSVSPALCLGIAPKREQPCNRLPCPVYWQEQPWTPCSTTCGRGVSTRPLYCPATEDFLCGPKPKERRRRCWARRCPSPTCHHADASNYCELFSDDELKRFCQASPFRKYCCHACKKWRS